MSAWKGSDRTGSIRYFADHPEDFQGTLNIKARDGCAIYATGLIQRKANNALIAVACSPHIKP